MDGFIGRASLSALIEQELPSLFGEDVEIVPFGVEEILPNNSNLSSYLRRLDYINGNSLAMALEFVPDYILFKKSAPQDIYFLEVKCSITPCWPVGRVNKIRSRHGVHIDETMIGEIAREPLMIYKRYYPKTIVLMGATYNKKKLMAQFASQINCLYCYGHEDCTDCPSMNGGYFEIERNVNANGSQTPNTNIDLSNFEECEEFFGKLDIRVNTEIVSRIKEILNERGVNIPTEPDAMSDYRKKFINYVLEEDGVLVSGQDYYVENRILHLNQDCPKIRNRDSLIRVNHSDGYYGCFACANLNNARRY